MNDPCGKVDIRKIAFRLRATFFTGKIKKLTDFTELKKSYMDFTHSIDLDDLYASFETEIQQAIDADNYNTYLRYYDNKGMLITFAKQLALESKMPYKEAVFAFLNNHKEVLAELRAKYFPDITVVNVTVRKK